MKAFPEQKYFKDWIYLGTINRLDYYLQALPTQEEQTPSTGIVHGPEATSIMLGTIPVLEMMENNLCIRYVKQYLETEQYHLIHLITLIRSYLNVPSSQQV